MPIAGVITKRERRQPHRRAVPQAAIAHIRPAINARKNQEGEHQRQLPQSFNVLKKARYTKSVINDSEGRSSKRATAITHKATNSP